MIHLTEIQSDIKTLGRVECIAQACTGTIFPAIQMGQSPNPFDLEKLFRYEVLKMLKAEGKINNAVIENMLSWHHSGFNVYCGNTIWPHDKNAMEKLARYIIRAAFSQERMNYITAGQSSDGVAKVIYQSKNRNGSKNFRCEFDHFHGAKWNKLSETWPLCCDCIKDLTFGVRSRTGKVLNAFEFYQQRVGQYFSTFGQMELQFKELEGDNYG